MQQSQTASLANQMKHRDREMVPRVLVVAMFALMVASLALVSFARLTDRPLTGTLNASPIVQDLALTMQGDRSRGIGLLDASGRQVAHSTDTRSGFIEVIWMSVTRARKVTGADPTAPIHVVRRADGKVAILDQASGFEIALIGYGADNVAAFARLLDNS